MNEPERVWRVCIDLPIDLDRELKDRFFAAICDAVDTVEPEDRDGWDSFVYTTVVPIEAAR